MAGNALGCKIKVTTETQMSRLHPSTGQQQTAALSFPYQNSLFFYYVCIFFIATLKLFPLLSRHYTLFFPPQATFSITLFSSSESEIQVTLLYLHLV